MNSLVPISLALVALLASNGSASAAPKGDPSGVCEVLKKYPHADGDKLAFDAGEISPLCTPFIRQRERKELDRCGDFNRDPYASLFTWSSRNEMSRRGKANFFTDPMLQAQLPRAERRVEDIRRRATDLCCGGDSVCREMMGKVEVTFCKPSSDPNAPDPCVFGGSYKMSGDGYASVFRLIQGRLHGAQAVGPEAAEIRHLAARNLTASEGRDGEASALSSGSIVLSSYVPREQGVAAIDPTMLHEFGHACSMVRMQEFAISGSASGSASGSGGANPGRALRATQYLDRARSRCQPDLELPEAYYDLWESVGETRGLAQCLYNLTTENQKNRIDRSCPNLCPGHFLEESVGIAFSLLLGDLNGATGRAIGGAAGGAAGAVFPQTCDHVRDGQHPMVSDVLECLAQNSPRFRARLSVANSCHFAFAKANHEGGAQQ